MAVGYTLFPAPCTLTVHPIPYTLRTPSLLRTPSTLNLRPQEVTQTSLGVGYELGYACAIGKPVLALWRPQEGKVLSAMIGDSPLPAPAPHPTINYSV